MGEKLLKDTNGSPLGFTLRAVGIKIVQFIDEQLVAMDNSFATLITEILLMTRFAILAKIQSDDTSFSHIHYQLPCRKFEIYYPQFQTIFSI